MPDPLLLYRTQMRRDRPGGPGQRVERTAHVTRITCDIPGIEFGSIVYNDLDAHNADAVILAEIEYFAKMGRAFEWKVYGNDLPTDLEDRLFQHGFRPSDREMLLAWEAGDFVATSPPSGIVVKKLVSPDQISDLGLDNAALETELMREMRETPKCLSIYAAWAGKQVVAHGWIRFYEQRDFADLWGGGTREEFRRRGIYRSLVSARLTEARKRDVKFVTTDALPTSQPILEKIGFRALTSTTPYLWVPLSQ